MTSDQKEEVECLMENIRDVSDSLDRIQTSETDDYTNADVESIPDLEATQLMAANVKLLHQAIHHLNVSRGILQTLIDKN